MNIEILDMPNPAVEASSTTTAPEFPMQFADGVRTFVPCRTSTLRFERVARFERWKLWRRLIALPEKRQKELMKDVMLGRQHRRFKSEEDLAQYARAFNHWYETIEIPRVRRLARWGRRMDEPESE